MGALQDRDNLGRGPVERAAAGAVIRVGPGRISPASIDFTNTHLQRNIHRLSSTAAHPIILLGDTSGNGTAFFALPTPNIDNSTQLPRFQPPNIDDRTASWRPRPPTLTTVQHFRASVTSTLTTVQNSRASDPQH